MGLISYGAYIILNGIIPGKLATIVAIIIAALIYFISLAILKIFNEEEIKSLPAGDKILKIFKKVKIY